MNKLIISILIATASQTYATEGTFDVHEWGTFTSVQGSNGQVLGGMSHEEEALPSFVAGRDLLTENKFCRISKAMPVCDDDVPGPVVHSGEVTQKMETPVLYFHSDRERQVRVRVDFPNGIISQYFPQPSSFAPAIGRATGLRYSSATFDVNVLMAPVAIPAVPSTSVYAPARNVAANFITTGKENEKFIFYRGLANFQTEVNVTSVGGALAINNNAVNYVPSVFAIDVNADGSGAVKALGSIVSTGRLTLTADELERFRAAKKPAGLFLADAANQLNAALRKSGMNRDEAEAMTNTWKNSYFRNPGLRVLYVLSRAETDRLLPLSIDPQPQNVERALVGRIELILDTEEAAMLTDLQNDTLSVAKLGRFAEPKLRRLEQLTQDPALADKIRALIATVK